MTEAEPLVPLGQTKIMVSRLGLGTWAWGDRFYWGYGRGGYSDADLQEAYQVSIAGGINFFDTAEVYGVGKSEKFLGSFINGYREDLEPADGTPVIATKFFPYPWRFLGSSLERALRQSISRLGVERVDLYQAHWPWPPRSIETWVTSMARSVERDLVRAVGVSNYSLDLMRRAQKVLERFGLNLSSNQVEYSLLHRSAETSGLLEACREDEITLIAYSPIASGVLSGKYTPENPPPGPRGRRYTPKFLERLQPLFELMDEIGRAHGGVTYNQISLNWVIAKGALPIPGAKNAAQASENLGALGWSLTEDDVDALDRVSERVQVDGD